MLQVLGQKMQKRSIKIISQFYNLWLICMTCLHILENYLKILENTTSDHRNLRKKIRKFFLKTAGYKKKKYQGASRSRREQVIAIRNLFLIFFLLLLLFFTWASSRGAFAPKNQYIQTFPHIYHIRPVLQAYFQLELLDFCNLVLPLLICTKQKCKKKCYHPMLHCPMVNTSFQLHKKMALNLHGTYTLFSSM